MRIGIFGGTFNPIHQGHLIVAEEIRQRFDLKRVLFVPSARPPHKPVPELIEGRHRLEMTRLAVQGNPAFEVSDIEQARQGFSYSVETVESLRRVWGKQAVLFFILGIDAFADLKSWHEPRRLVTLCNFIVMSRPGFSLTQAYPMLSETFGIKTRRGSTRVKLADGHVLHLTEVTAVGISSTLIRDRIAKGESVKYLLPEAVESYILSHALYGGK